MHAFEQLINLLAPHRCISCHAEGTLLCDSCLTSVLQPPDCCFKCGKAAARGLCDRCHAVSAVETLTAATTYADTGKILVHRLKFERARAAAQPIARLLAEQLPDNKPYVVVPIPTAPRRVRQRGYDQAVLIAKVLARISGRHYAPLLRRVTNTRQLGQQRTARREQLQAAFVASPKLLGTKSHILLIDDVLTTGASVEAAAITLRNAGYAHVGAAVFAVARAGVS